MNEIAAWVDLDQASAVAAAMLRQPHLKIGGVPEVVARVVVGALEVEQVLGRRCGYAD